LEGEKSIFSFFFPFLLGAESFNDLVKKIDNSLILKIAKKDILIQKKKLDEMKAKKYGKLDLTYTYSHLFSTPEMKLDLLQPIAVKNAGNAPVYPLIYQNIHSEMEMGSKENYIASLIYSYPIFTGFAISEGIKIEKLNLIKFKLKYQNIKRNLILKVGNLYSNVYALNAEIKALNEAKKALILAKEKALALYNEGLLNKSNVDEIDAKYYETEAKIREVKSQKNQFLNLLSYILNYKVKNIEVLSHITLKKPIFLNRPDVKEILTTLKISKHLVKLSKSNFFPKLFFQGGVKREAENLTLSKNNHQNIDKSFVAISLQYNIFNGGADKAKIEEARLNNLKATIYFSNYLNRVKIGYKNDLLMINSLKSRLLSAQKEIKARRSYYKYIKAKFNEGLADVVDLNEAISKLAEAKAKKAYVKSQIFFYILKANIDGGNFINLK